MMIADEKNKAGLSAFQLKIIALFFMTLDHVAAIGIISVLPIPRGVIDVYELFRILGRIAAPLFLFLLVEGLRHTRSKPRYIVRLYIAAVLIGIVNLAFVRTVADPNAMYTPGNILPTFLYAALFITCIEIILKSVKEKAYRSIILPTVLMILPFVFSLIFNLVNANANSLGAMHYWLQYGIKIITPPMAYVEYSFLFVLLGISWYFVKRKTYNCIIFAGLCAVSYFVDANFVIGLMRVSPLFRFSFFELFIGTQWCMVLAIPFITLYNGYKGRGCKYLFYAYYPLHQYLLYGLMLLLR
jgi:hypothetical protein